MKKGNPLFTTERSVSQSRLVELLTENGLKVSRLQLISEGWDFFVYLLNLSHILRVPKRSYVAARARQEIAVLDSLRFLVSVSLPCYDIVIETDETNGLLFGYPRLEGKPFDLEAPATQVQRLAEPVGNLLSTLHGLARKSNVRIDSVTKVLELQGQASEAVAMLSPLLTKRQQDKIAKRLKAKITLGDHRVPIHNDLRPDHLLLSDNGLAVIDWTDIAWGYPWEDLLHLWVSCGDHIVEEVSQYYKDWDPLWNEFIRIAGTWKGIVEWRYAIETEDETKSAQVEKFLQRL